MTYGNNTKHIYIIIAISKCCPLIWFIGLVVDKKTNDLQMVMHLNKNYRFSIKKNADLQTRYKIFFERERCTRIIFISLQIIILLCEWFVMLFKFVATFIEYVCWLSPRVTSHDAISWNLPKLWRDSLCKFFLPLPTNNSLDWCPKI